MLENYITHPAQTMNIRKSLPLPRFDCQDSKHTSFLYRMKSRLLHHFTEDLQNLRKAKPTTWNAAGNSSYQTTKQPSNLPATARARQQRACNIYILPPSHKVCDAKDVTSCNDLRIKNVFLRRFPW